MKKLIIVIGLLFGSPVAAKSEKASVFLLKMPHSSSWVQPIYGFPSGSNDSLNELSSTNLIALRGQAGAFPGDYGTKKIRQDRFAVESFFAEMRDGESLHVAEILDSGAEECSATDPSHLLFESIPKEDVKTVEQLLCLETKTRRTNEFLAAVFFSTNRLARPLFVLSFSERGFEFAESDRTLPLRFILGHQVPVFIYANTAAKKTKVYQEIIKWRNQRIRMEDLPGLANFLAGGSQRRPVFGRTGACVDRLFAVCGLKKQMDLHEERLSLASKTPVFFAHQNDSLLRHHLNLSFFKNFEIDLFYEPEEDDFRVRHDKVEKTKGPPLAKFLKMAEQAGVQKIWLDWKNSEESSGGNAERTLKILLANTGFSRDQIVIERSVGSKTKVDPNYLKEWTTALNLRISPNGDVPSEKLDVKSLGLGFNYEDREKYSTLTAKARALYTWSTPLDPTKVGFEKEAEKWSDYSGVVISWPETFYQQHSPVPLF